ncbi:MAG: Smr/MutS family endonuclease [Gammaproteobacteria bacterium]|nr:Smr/MutS family endonuclease [Gammaproteobacteria bacterium]MDH5777859.1 Smr/MutS family endonuclease [Gammaproteobacteria bacterium]
MSKNNDNPDDDAELFRAEFSDIRELAQDKVPPFRQSRPPRPAKREQDDQQVLKDMLSDPIDLAEVETGEELLFARDGIQPKVLQKLRRGQYSIEAELDLHRMTSDQARAALSNFINQSVSSGLRTVRIIHGKGHGSPGKLPVLKNKVNHWLKQKDQILAFCSSRPVDGGTGAIYVLLKRLR